MSILGAMILDNSKIEKAKKAGLNEDHFVDRNEKVILEKIYYLHDKKTGATFENVLPEILKTQRRKRKKEELENKLHIVCENAEGGDFVQAVSKLKFYSKRNRLLSLSEMINDMAKDVEYTPAIVASKAIEELEKIAQPVTFKDNGDYEIALKNVMRVFDEGMKKGSYLATGLDQLDEMILGYKMGELYMITAATGQGKSALIISLLCAQIRMKFKSTLFALEMSKEDVLYRIVSNIAEIDSKKLQRGKNYLSNDERARANTVASGLFEEDMHLFDPSGIDIVELRSRIVELANKGCKLFFIDQMTLISSTERDKIEKLTGIVRQLRQTAKYLNICIVLAHQPSKAAQKRAEETRGEAIPSHLDMRDAPVENDPSVVLVVHRKEFYAKEKTKEDDKGTAIIKVSKNRFGIVGQCKVGFRPEFSKFYDII